MGPCHVFSCPSYVPSQGTRAAQPTTSTTRRNWPCRAESRPDSEAWPAESAASISPSLRLPPPLPSARSHGTRDTDTHTGRCVEEKENKTDMGLVSADCRLRRRPRRCRRKYMCTPPQQRKAPTLFSATLAHTEAEAGGNFMTRNLGNVGTYPAKPWQNNLVACRARLEIRARTHPWQLRCVSP